VTFTLIGRLNYSACEKAGISVISGLIADYVFQLQDTEKDGWCKATNKVFADLTKICTRQVVRSINDLLDKNLLDKNGINQNRGLRTTDLYRDLFCLAVTLSHSEPPETLPAVTLSHSDLVETDFAVTLSHSETSETIPAVTLSHSDLFEPDLAVTLSHSEPPENLPAVTQSHSELVKNDFAVTLSHSEQKNQENFANSSSSILVLDSYTNKILKEEEKNKILSEKTKKNSAEKKSPAGKYPEGFFSKCKTRYEVWREVNGWQPEYFTAKELGNLRNLINALAFSIREIDSEGTPSPTNYDEVYIAFDAFFGNMPSRIMQQPISLSMLYSRYNEIMGEQHLTGKLYSPEIEAVIASFRKENKSLPQDYVSTDAERKAVIELQKLLTASAKSKNPTTNPSPEQV